MRTRVTRTLNTFSVETLLGVQPARAESPLVKAGILPFLPAASMENWRVCLMKPVARHPGRGAPDFQLAKGTRMQADGGTWHDMQESETPSAHAETLLETALREAIEEIGLEIEKISRIFDAGAQDFISASKGSVKRMHIFAAQMPDTDCLNPAALHAAATAECGWFSCAELATKAREDHARIIRAILVKVAKHFPC